VFGWWMVGSCLYGRIQGNVSSVRGMVTEFRTFGMKKIDTKYVCLPPSDIVYVVSYGMHI